MYICIYVYIHTHTHTHTQTHTHLLQIIEDGQRVQRAPLSLQKQVDFGEKIGRRRTMILNLPEVRISRVFCMNESRLLYEGVMSCFL